MFKNTTTTYGLFARAIHWVMAVMIIALIIVGYYMSDLSPSDDKWYIYGMHKSTGVLILVLVLVRIVFRLSSIQPQLPEATPGRNAKLASINVFLLYCLMLAQPLSGFFGSLTAGRDISFYGLYSISSFGEFQALSKILWEMHSILSYILIACIVGHFIGAIYHHFILKDNVLRRMWRGSI